MRERRDYVDWLRVLGMLAVFLFHSARFFDHTPWHVKNGITDFAFSVYTASLSQWIMPLMFVISGASTAWALGTRPSRRFLRDRFLRLIIPFVFGTLVLIPPQVYLERLSHLQFEGSFVEFYPRYFEGFYAFGGNFAWMGLHLWYLLVLFLFSMILLPLLIYLKSDFASRHIPALVGNFEKPGALLLLALPLAVLEIVLDPDSIGRRDFGGWNLFAYAIYFVYGYVFFSHRGFERAIQRHTGFAVVVALATPLLMLPFVSPQYVPNLGGLEYPLGMALRALNSWLWIVAIFGLGHRYLSFGSRRLRFVSEQVLPFYVFHQTVILIVGFFVVFWDASLIFKYLIIALTSLVATLGLCHLVRRLNVLRPLFGLRLRENAATDRGFPRRI